MLFRCMHMCNDTCELFSVFVYTPVHSWRVLTEGHGSCTLSVWTLAEPLGVLFQARSDNLAPMTRLATAQFTGRSSTHAQPPPSPTTSLPPVLPWSPICSPCTLIYSPIPLHFPFLSTSFNLSLHAVFFSFFYNPSCFPFSLRSYHTVVHRIETACWHLAEIGPAVLPMETICL